LSVANLTPLLAKSVIACSMSATSREIWFTPSPLVSRNLAIGLPASSEATRLIATSPMPNRIGVMLRRVHGRLHTQDVGILLDRGIKVLYSYTYVNKPLYRFLYP